MAEPSLPPAGRGPQLRYFGYSTAGPPRVIQEIVPYTNVVLIRDWVDRSNETIVAAEEAGLPIVLGVQGKEMTGGAAQLHRVLSRRSGAVVGVCWFFPYSFGFKPSDVANVGRKIKQDYPGVQYWVASVDKPPAGGENPPVPPVVDVLLVAAPFDNTPQAVKAKAEECLPSWLERAAGRPIVWLWMPALGSPRGLERGVVPTTEPGTYRACVEMAQEHKLAGVIFDRYGRPKGQERVPIDSRPELVEEIRGLAGELGIGTSSTAPAN